MFQNTTVSSRSSSSRSGNNNSCGRNSSMPSLRMRSPLSPKTSYNPLFRHSDAFTSFDASHFIFQEQKHDRITSKRVPILRRYNSHDSHTNFTDIRLESKNDTPDSTKSRSDSRSTPQTSPNSTGDRKTQEFEARDFLERYSLPRVVRVSNGQPQLLYRCFDSFTKIQARGLTGKKGKEKHDNNILHFPEGYSGWFSLMNEKGEKSAIMYTSVLQLVREQVCSFINIQPFTAYAGHNSELADTSGKVQYLKTQVRSGQLFQLRAVFQHRERTDCIGRHSTKSSKNTTRTTRDKDLANRYAQLISQNNQELYVPLTTKGEFYETHSSIKAKLCFPGLLDKTGPLALDKDCLYKITHLLRRVALPVKVKLLSGPLPPGLPKDFTDTFVLERKFQEPLMVTCTLPSSSDNVQHKISCINLHSNVKISKCMLGFESESRLFKSQRLQAALAYCHKNVESWYREVRLAPNLEQISSRTININRDDDGDDDDDDDDRRNATKYDEDIIIDNDGNNATSKQLITKEVIDKFHKPKKWYKHFKILGSSNETSIIKQTELIDGADKVKSIDRYKDMSKLIEEKFGKKSYNPVKKSASFMFSTKRIDLDDSKNQSKNNPAALLKCHSLDTQLYTSDDRMKVKLSENVKRSDASRDFSFIQVHEEYFDVKQRMISKREPQSLRESNPISLQITDINLDEIKPADGVKLKKSKPDLIPTLTKDNSFLTDRLCSEFHVKTKLQKRGLSRNNDKLHSSYRDESLTNFSIIGNKAEPQKDTSNKTSIVVQVHEITQKTKQQQQQQIQKNQLDVEDIPYSHVADEITDKVVPKKPSDENIYAEICENSCNCVANKNCDCKRTTTAKKSEYCYVKLGSNGESITSDSDEAIYNTLR